MDGKSLAELKAAFEKWWRGGAGSGTCERRFPRISCSGHARQLGITDRLQWPDAKAAVIAEMSKRVRLAREQAGLTQAALAKRLAVTQAMVSRAESGTARISGAYIGRVLKACKLPADWVPEP